ncbi:polysaccharide export protein [candidate division WOR-3 bacterium]|nr:polysaccharide export protein [candidate division WOR-3 bacterium]
MRKGVALVLIFSCVFGANLDLVNVLLTQTVAQERYKIEPGDVLEIVILGEEELSRTLMVMHNGTISFPLIGEVKVAGLSTDDAAALLGQELKQYFTHPVVSIILKSPTLPYVSVFGEVLRQGAIEYQRGLRVSDYVALAGGPTASAGMRKVKVARLVPQKTGVMSVETIDLDRILKQGLMDQNFELKSGDWVYVPRKFTVNWGLVATTLTLAATLLNLYITYGRLSD